MSYKKNYFKGYNFVTFCTIKNINKNLPETMDFK